VTLPLPLSARLSIQGLHHVVPLSPPINGYSDFSFGRNLNVHQSLERLTPSSLFTCGPRKIVDALISIRQQARYFTLCSLPPFLPPFPGPHNIEMSRPRHWTQVPRISLRVLWKLSSPLCFNRFSKLSVLLAMVDSYPLQYALLFSAFPVSRISWSTRPPPLSG